MLLRKIFSHRNEFITPTGSNQVGSEPGLGPSCRQPATLVLLNALAIFALIAVLAADVGARIRLLLAVALLANLAMAAFISAFAAVVVVPLEVHAVPAALLLGPRACGLALAPLAGLILATVLEALAAVLVVGLQVCASAAALLVGVRALGLAVAVLAGLPARAVVVAFAAVVLIGLQIHAVPSASVGLIPGASRGIAFAFLAVPAVLALVAALAAVMIVVGEVDALAVAPVLGADLLATAFLALFVLATAVILAALGLPLGACEDLLAAAILALLVLVAAVVFAALGLPLRASEDLLAAIVLALLVLATALILTTLGRVSRAAEGFLAFPVLAVFTVGTDLAAGTAVVVVGLEVDAVLAALCLSVVAVRPVAEVPRIKVCGGQRALYHEDGQEHEEELEGGLHDGL
jgi:hypothetical protein